ncbi:glucose uptake inhibitor SgrT [Dongshaea marina]|uniref:glucose uptake inhibitor SgrT n=1 Tax=Dongshaea marina TaxID=2047966 RepID=UPI00131EFAF6|nr:glucose uptake inhibitor SgrT [Dongshaea marina]
MFDFYRQYLKNIGRSLCTPKEVTRQRLEVLNRVCQWKIPYMNEKDYKQWW